MKNIQKILTILQTTILLTATTATMSFCLESTSPNMTPGSVDYPEGVLNSIASKNGRGISVTIDEKTYKIHKATKISNCGKPEANIDFLYESIGEDIAYLETDTTGSLNEIMAICKQENPHQFCLLRTQLC